MHPPIELASKKRHLFCFYDEIRSVAPSMSHGNELTPDWVERVDVAVETWNSACRRPGLLRACQVLRELRTGMRRGNRIDEDDWKLLRSFLHKQMRRLPCISMIFLFLAPSALRMSSPSLRGVRCSAGETTSQFQQRSRAPHPILQQRRIPPFSHPPAPHGGVIRSAKVLFRRYIPGIAILTAPVLP